jgi:hypothetical protein
VTGDAEPVIRVRVGDVVRCGRAITVETAVESSRVAAAVRSPDAGSEKRSGEGENDVAVDAPEPGPVHEHVGHVHPGMGLRTRTALARAARSQGLETPYDEDIRTARERLAAITAEEGDVAPRRRALAEARAETDRLRERVATARGRLQAARAHDVEATSVAAELEAAVRELSEVETDGEAARQRLQRARERARDRRDRRERARKLEDRVANLERAARAYLVDRWEDRYARILGRTPGAGDRTDPFAAEPVIAALAVARLAALSAPVVLSCDRFASARAASRWLDATVVILSDASP